MEASAKVLKVFQSEIRSLLISLKGTIDNDCRAHEGATVPGIAVTIGAEITGHCIAWDYQTGDNSYTGGAYGFRHWGICDLHRRDNCSTLAADIVDQFRELWAQDSLENSLV